MFINESQDSKEETSIFKLLLGARCCATHVIKNSKNGYLPARCFQTHQADKAA